MTQLKTTQGETEDTDKKKTVSELSSFSAVYHTDLKLEVKSANVGTKQFSNV